MCSVQNVDAQAHTDAEEIKANLIAQLTASVRWTQEVQNMIAAGATDFTECGPGKVLQGMIGKIAKGNDAVTAHGIQPKPTRTAIPLPQKNGKGIFIDD